MAGIRAHAPHSEGPCALQIQVLTTSTGLVCHFRRKEVMMPVFFPLAVLALTGTRLVPMIRVSLYLKVKCRDTARDVAMSGLSAVSEAHFVKTGASLGEALNFNLRASGSWPSPRTKPGDQCQPLLLGDF